MQNTIIRRKIAELIGQATEQVMSGKTPEKYQQLIGRVAGLKDLDQFIEERNHEDDADQQETISST